MHTYSARHEGLFVFALRAVFPRTMLPNNTWYLPGNPPCVHLSVGVAFHEQVRQLVIVDLNGRLNRRARRPRPCSAPSYRTCSCSSCSSGCSCRGCCTSGACVVVDVVVAARLPVADGCARAAGVSAAAGASVGATGDSAGPGSAGRRTNSVSLLKCSRSYRRAYSTNALTP